MINRNSLLLDDRTWSENHCKWSVGHARQRCPSAAANGPRKVPTETSCRGDCCEKKARGTNLKTWQEGHCLENQNDAAAAAAAAAATALGLPPSRPRRCTGFQLSFLNLTEQGFVSKKIAFGSVPVMVIIKRQLNAFDSSTLSLRFVCSENVRTPSENVA